MRMNKWSIGFAAIVALAACGDDDGTGGTSGTGGTGGSGGTSGSGGMSGSGGTGGTGGNTDCTLEAIHVTDPEDNLLSNLSVGDDKVVFIAANPTTLLGTIEAIGADGTGRTTLYTPTGSRRVHSVMVDGDTVYFVEQTENVVTEHELFSIPASGGTATRVGDASIERGYIVGFDATHIFVLEKTINGSSFLRIAKSDGARERIGAAADGGTYIHVQLAGDDLFFVTGVPSTVYQLAKSASDVDATELWASPMSGDRCGFPLGGLFATGDKLVCGFTSLAARDRDGTGEVVLFDGDVLSGIKTPLASDGNNFYYADPGQGSALIRHDITDDSETVVACDTGVVANQRVDAGFVIQNEYEVVVGSTDVFWIEMTVSQDAPTFEIRRTPK